MVGLGPGAGLHLTLRCNELRGDDVERGVQVHCSCDCGVVH